MSVKEPVSQFEKRKEDHLKLSLEARNQTGGLSGFDQVMLIHEALPDGDFDPQRTLMTLNLLGQTKPFLVSSMTAGHVGSVDFNLRLAKACEKTGWLMGVGSQRRELFDPGASDEWLRLREHCPQIQLLGNLGITQLIQVKIDRVIDLVQKMQAKAMIIHTNPLQEVLQQEGTPYFSGAMEALKELCCLSPVPVVLKETGCGFSKFTLQRLVGVGLGAVDVSGLGGTHWGRIEGGRAHSQHLQRASKTFENWGISTLQSLVNAQGVQDRDYRVWASGGLRNGLDAVKAFCLGAEVVGFAKPVLEAAQISSDAVVEWMELVEFEVRAALFLSGVNGLNELPRREVLRWQN